MDEDAKEFAKRKEISTVALNIREHDESNNRTDSEDRTGYSRDYARVLYSSSFRRLQGKMQLLGIDETRFNRNRLTHSLEVAQIARGLATSLKLSETIVSETCALIHDIGNPPFGHSGERVLNDLTQSVGGYEGNAQAFRIIRSLEKKHPNCAGLNLTIRTLWGTVKYFNSREQNKKKFLYPDDYSYLSAKLNEFSISDKKSIDAEIMDLADEIAYAAHDLEDALSSNLLVIGELIHEFSIDDDFKDASEKIKQIVKEVQRIAGNSNQLSTSEEYSIVFKKELTSRIVNELIQDIGLVEEVNGKSELGYKSLAKLAKGLKKLVFKVVLRKRHIQEYESRGEKVIRGLFEVYSDCLLYTS
ncbi:dNTP triphosphohydrolase, partial [Undibacterium sp. 10I3]